MFTYLTRQPPWFAFLIHPRDNGDVLRDGVGSLLRQYSSSDADSVLKFSSLPPIVAGSVRIRSSAVRGEIVSVMCVADDVLGARGRHGLLAAARLAVGRGASVLGLGGLTAPALGGGELLLRHLPAAVTLTNGNAYTAAVLREQTLAAVARLGTPAQRRVAVLGCTGSVGMATSHLLAEEGLDLVLVGRTAARARALLGPLGSRVVFSGNVADVRQADVVVAVTSDPSARLIPEFLSPNTIVIDAAQPPNVPRAARPLFEARRITVVEGGLVHIPGFTCTYDVGIADPQTTFACLAETYLYAREGIRDHSVGRPSAEAARRMERIARRRGVTPRPLEFDPVSVPRAPASRERAVWNQVGQ